jgi:hypothetical protein
MIDTIFVAKCYMTSYGGYDSLNADMNKKKDTTRYCPTI